MFKKYIELSIEYVWAAPLEYYVFQSVVTALAVASGVHFGSLSFLGVLIFFAVTQLVSVVLSVPWVLYRVPRLKKKQ